MNLQESRIDNDYHFNNGLNDLENLQNRYGGDFPLNDNTLPDELQRLKRRDLLKKRAIIVMAALLCFYIIIRLFRY